MKLTKEECQIALNTIKDLNDYPIQCTTNETQDKFQMIPFVELFSDEIGLIDELIKEHFDNPPLKFEENEKWLISKIFQNYYCMGIDEIAEEDETAKSIFEKIGLIEVSS